VSHRPTQPEPALASFEDWLVTQTSATRPRRQIAQLMLDQRLNEVDFGARAVRAEFRRMLDDFESATLGLWVRSAPLPRRSARTGTRSVLGLPEEGTSG
jgi:hypothetical protein